MLLFLCRNSRLNWKNRARAEMFHNQADGRFQGHRPDQRFSPRISPAGVWAGFKLKDCFLPLSPEVVLAIKKPPRHHS
jgi:hypothetical protein